MNKPHSVSPRRAKRIERALMHPERLIWRLTCETGLRVSDALSLQVAHVQPSKRAINAWESKSKRQRQIAISGELHSALCAQAADRPADHWLFPSVRDYRRHYSRMTYHRRLKSAHKRISAHSARKLYAQNIYRNTRSIAAVQNALHHHQIATTATYLDIPVKRLHRQRKKSLISHIIAYITRQ